MYPEIMDDPKYAEEAKRLMAEANEYLDMLIEKNEIVANGVVGIFPANSVGDSIEVYDEVTGEVKEVFHTLRQQHERRAGEKNLALSDYIAPKDSGYTDYIAAFAVTGGINADEVADRFKKDNDDYSSLMIRVLATRFAEAFAEWLHEELRKELWAYAPNESLTLQEKLRTKYDGIRPAIGYPSLPDHSEKKTLFRLLDVEKNTGITLTENYSMAPGASVSGIIYGHKDAKYFNITKVSKDQVEDYAQRKGVSIEDIEKNLAHNLNYK